MGCNCLTLHMIIYYMIYEFAKNPKDRILLDVNPKFDKGKIGSKRSNDFRRPVDRIFTVAVERVDGRPDGCVGSTGNFQ